MQELVQLGGHRCAGTGERAWIAPAFARAVEPAGFGEPGNRRLDFRPRIPRVTVAGIEDHRRTPGARAEDVQAPPTDIHRPADLRQALAIPALPNLFVNGSREPGDEDTRAEPFGDENNLASKPGLLPHGHDPRPRPQCEGSVGNRMRTPCITPSGLRPVNLFARPP